MFRAQRHFSIYAIGTHVTEKSTAAGRQIIEVRRRFYVRVKRMGTITFDTHKFVRRLEDAGFERNQAEAVANAFYDAAADVAPVTRDYFDVKLKAEIEAAKADIIKWVAGLLIAQAAVVATMVKLLG